MSSLDQERERPSAIPSIPPASRWQIDFSDGSSTMLTANSITSVAEVARYIAPKGTVPVAIYLVPQTGG